MRETAMAHEVIRHQLPLFDEDGNFKGYRGTGRDVTQQRLGETH